jgi:hypothetical protein
MDGYAISPSGVERLENRELKAALGFDVVQSFPSAPVGAVRPIDTALPDDCDAPAN